VLEFFCLEIATIELKFCHLWKLSLPQSLIKPNRETVSMERKPANILEIVEREQRHSLSDREWKHRLRGYGHSIKSREDGLFVTSLLGGEEICRLPQDLAA
jgi:hypothetical protein